jgi:hypothetical protein
MPRGRICRAITGACSRSSTEGDGVHANAFKTATPVLHHTATLRMQFEDQGLARSAQARIEIECKVLRDNI